MKNAIQRAMKGSIKLHRCVIVMFWKGRLSLLWPTYIISCNISRSKKWHLFNGNYWYFHYCCSKHRVWVLISGSNEYPQSMFWSKGRKNKIYPTNPTFVYIKWGFSGRLLHGLINVMSFIRDIAILFSRRSEKLAGWQNCRMKSCLELCSTPKIMDTR